MISPWMDDAQAAAYLGLKGKYPEKVLHRWVRQKRLLAGRCGDHYRYLQEHLDAFLVSRMPADIRKAVMRRLGTGGDYANA